MRMSFFTLIEQYQHIANNSRLTMMNSDSVSNQLTRRDALSQQRQALVHWRPQICCATIKRSPRHQIRSRRRSPITSAKAKSVIFLFMEGGPSHIDTFDPKPLLNKLAGKPIPESFGKVITAMGEYGSPLLESKHKWKQYGKGGTWVSDWYPHIAEHADDIAVLHPVWADGINHSAGVCQMNTGSILAGQAVAGFVGFVRSRLGE